MYNKLKQIARKMFIEMKKEFELTTNEQQRIALIEKVIAGLKVVQLQHDDEVTLKKKQLDVQKEERKQANKEFREQNKKLVARGEQPIKKEVEPKVKKPKVVRTDGPKLVYSTISDYMEMFDHFNNEKIPAVAQKPTSINAYIDKFVEQCASFDEYRYSDLQLRNGAIRIL